MSIDSSRVLCLGGTTGIGLATAKLASSRGAHVTVVSNRQGDVDNALRQLPKGADGYAADLLDPEQRAELFQKVDTIDHLVYTAGQNIRFTKITDYTTEAGNTMLGLRVVCALDVVRLAIPHMSDEGSITLTSGTSAFRPGPGWSIVGAFCGAINSAIKALAVELAPIRVNAVAPGVVNSPLWDQVGSSESNEEFAQLASALPAGRVAEADDIAMGYVYLMEQEYATGSVLLIDGGTLVMA
jgi:NAD(P)-dependent dehydrogenase (short-subunit alcohol dehydrogenase family)